MLQSQEVIPWGDVDDAWAFVSVIVSVLIVFAVFFDNQSQRISHRLHHRASEHRHEALAEYREKMYYLVWIEFHSEITTLGFLAFCCWMSDQAGLLNLIVSLMGGDEDGGPYEKRVPQSDYFHVPCFRRKPKRRAELMNLIEHGHMALFVSMAAYFAFVTIVLMRLVRRLGEYEKQEVNAALDPPVPPNGRHEESTARWLNASRRYVLTRVLDGHADELKDLHEIRATMNAGILDYTAYLEATMEDQFERMIEFSPATWGLVWVYFSMLGAASWWFCFTEYFTFTFVLDGWFLFATLYMSIRISIFQRGVSQNVAAPWPCQILDRATFLLVGPGITGFVPWRRNPEELPAVRCTQAMLFFEFWWVAYRLLPNAATHEWEIFRGESWVRGIFRILAVGYWAWYLLPTQLEIFALPPFIDEEELELLFETLEDNPNGCDPKLQCYEASDVHLDTLEIRHRRRELRNRRALGLDQEAPLLKDADDYSSQGTIDTFPYPTSCPDSPISPKPNGEYRRGNRRRTYT